MSSVDVWSEVIEIPTYPVEEPNKNPMFLENRVYQGSSGRVYPHPVIDRVFDEKELQSYTALFLENRYLKVMVLPEIGGRVQMAVDKTNDYDFVYYNQVIKPALVGLCGPWIAGGIEFNWPQHHRPSTFQPVDYDLEEHDDGSCTVWCSEIERMYRTKGRAGFTMYPDRAYLEVRGRVYNRTDVPRTFLWWANPAVSVDDNYQAIFPPDVQAVMDHGKRDVSDFPIATGTYYKIDYSPGTDISWYRNIPVPTSYMAHRSDYDFLGGYDHGEEAGILHIADHHVSPGKKMWTWGTGDFGQTWVDQLTDEDGPYVELMCGVFTDNQPDFAWVMPGEEKRFSQVFMPYKKLGRVTEATREVVLRLEVEDDQATVGVYLTSPREVTIRLLCGDHCVFEHTATLTPEEPLLREVDLEMSPAPLTVRLEVWEEDTLLLADSPLPEQEPEIPDPATAAPPPEEVDSPEALYLHGLHLEQYRHATYAPEPYYKEALERDPGASRPHTALGRRLYRKGQFEAAERHFRQAIDRLTMRNPNPYEGEPFYDLGLALRMQGRFDEAYDAFYKAIWNDAWKGAGFFELARLACRGEDYEEALAFVDKALDNKENHHKARHLRTLILRCLGHQNEALEEIDRSLDRDSLNLGIHFERAMLTVAAPLPDGVRGDAETLIEVALDYAHAGQAEGAARVFAEAPSDPMIGYYRGWIALQNGADDQADTAFEQARARPPTYCFPNRIECVPALQAAIDRHPDDPRAPYYLGNFWYAHECYDKAIAMWERARDLDRTFPTVHRNLALAYMNKRDAPNRAEEALEEAFSCDPTDARVFYELDQLRKHRGKLPNDRLEQLEKRSSLVEERDDLMVERIALLNRLGRHNEALDLLLHRRFHPWEGGEGKVTEQYVVSLVQLAREAIAEERYEEAIERLESARSYPDNLGEGKLPIAAEHNIFYYLGRAHEELGQRELARDWYEKAAVGETELTRPQYYNDQSPEMTFYQGLACRKVGNIEKAQSIFNRLVKHGEEQIETEGALDYFAVSLPDFLVFEPDLDVRTSVHGHYVAALGFLGMRKRKKARHHFEAVLERDPSHLGAALHHPKEGASEELQA
jgi:tetratricopeptide (TPR) repeat protein